MATAAATSNFVVWEWMEDNGHWIPYSASICHSLENGLAARGIVHITFDVSISPTNRQSIKYDVDLSRMVQISCFSGNTRQIQRRLLPSSSVLVQKYIWEWSKGSKQLTMWTPYCTELMEEIEVNYKRSPTSFNFPLHYGLPYKLDFVKMIQTNLRSQFVRPIRRQHLKQLYPKDLGNAPIFNSSSQAPYPTTTSQAYSYVQPGASYPRSSFMPPPRSVPSGSLLRSHNHRWPTAGVPHTGPSHSMPPILTNTSPTNGSNKRKNTRKNVQLPTCPPGGIPCNSVASTGNVPVSQVMRTFTQVIDVESSSTDPCAICQYKLTDPSGFGNGKETSKLTQCEHVFHSECLETSYSHGAQNGCIVCPACNKTYGIKTGDQPPGTMTYGHMNSSLPGYGSCRTLQIQYDIRPGIQTSEHPHPGRRYSTSGFPRIAFLPDNDEGKRVLLLLIEAWKRRLIFTVGQSSTTGREDCVTWTSIHHKTELQNYCGHGYPDDTYLDRVLAELEAAGVVEDDT